MPHSTHLDRLDGLIDGFAALPPEEKRRQIEAAGRYLASAEGQREFGHLLRMRADGEERPFEQGLGQ